MERGNKKNRFLDRYIGIPLTLPSLLFHKLNKKKHYDVKNVVILCFGGIGDLLMGSALINGLKKELPNSKIDLITGINNREGGNLIDNIHCHYAFSVSNIKDILFTLRANQYDLLFDMTQWARIGSLISAFSYASTTVGFSTKNQYRSLPYDIKIKHSSNIHEFENFLNLGKALFPNLNGRPSIKISSSDFKLPKPYILFNMFASGSNSKEREWGNRNWADLALMLMAREYNVVVSGSKAQYSLVENFIKYSGSNNIINIAGKVSLSQLAFISQKSAAIVSINSGPMHIAALSGSPVIALNGPTNPLRWGGIGSNVVNMFPDNATEMLDLGFEKVSSDSNAENIKLNLVVHALSRFIKL